MSPHSLYQKMSHQHRHTPERDFAESECKAPPTTLKVLFHWIAHSPNVTLTVSNTSSSLRQIGSWEALILVVFAVFLFSLYCRLCRSQQQANKTSRKNTFGDDTINKILEINVDVISDTMCPWCWVGKRNLEIALRRANTAHRRIVAHIDWLPYILDKDLDENGTPVYEYYQKNYGNAMAGEDMKASLVTAGRACGLDLERHYVNRVTHYRPTIRSHKLISYARRYRLQNEMVEELFDMFCVQGKHLNCVDHLIEAADKVVGLDNDDREILRAYLESDQDEQEIYQHADEIKHLADCIPTFIFSLTNSRSDNVDALSFSGGQPPEDFLFAFDILAKMA